MATNQEIAAVMAEATTIAFETYLPLIAEVSAANEINPRLAICAMMLSTVALTHIDLIEEGKGDSLKGVLTDLLNMSVAAVPELLATMIGMAEAAGARAPSDVAGLVADLKAAA